MGKHTDGFNTEEEHGFHYFRIAKLDFNFLALEEPLVHFDSVKNLYLFRQIGWLIDIYLILELCSKIKYKECISYVAYVHT